MLGSNTARAEAFASSNTLASDCDGPLAPVDVTSNDLHSRANRAVPLDLSRHRAPLTAPTGLVPTPVRFTNVPAMIRAWTPDQPVFCLRPDALRRQAELFTRGFAGLPLYAVKCNPDPFVLTTLFAAGIHGFDVASLEEIRLIDDLFGTAAGLFFNNPAKSREAIRCSYAEHGVLFFTVDHPSELDKIVEEMRGAGTAVTVAVRLAAHAPSARYALSTKFGASSDVAVTLLQAAKRAGFRVGLSFHVGSQCLDPGAFGQALVTCREVLRRAGTEIELLNMGGGFPAPYPGDRPVAMQDYFTALELGRRALGLSPDCLILCEPGRALVGPAASTVMRVLMRKDDVLYCNDGIYGNLQELRSSKERRPARVLASDGSARLGNQPFRIYGPTCDSDDVLGAPLLLPADVREGEWIEIDMMGAYSSATRTPFNGFSAHSTIQIPG